ncbi:ABC transporter [Microbacterium sp. KR10-403]|uniref:ABC transporter n=1 Tax=Microbacterium sp. KR10-403 TaxID=3158581 RepID=UPI0032E3D3EE
MSDPQEPVGEPVEESTSVDDVVGRAHEGLAEAEAAGRDATDEAAAAASAPPADEPAVATSVEADAPVAAEPTEEADEPVFSTPALNDMHGTYGENVDTAATEQYQASREAVETEAYPAGAAAGAAAAASVAEPVAPQPIFVQAPEEPRPRGNRGAAGGIGLVAAVCFAALYLASGLVIGLVNGDITTGGLTDWLVDALSSWGLWVPTVVFFVAFWLLGAIINRGRWGAWVIIGLLVGVAAWGGHLLGQLFEAPFWNVTASQGADIVDQQLFAPLAIAAFIIGRELTIWFGAWAAARGKRMTALNVEARREYERTLEAGPQLAR